MINKSILKNLIFSAVIATSCYSLMASNVDIQKIKAAPADTDISSFYLSVYLTNDNAVKDIDSATAYPIRWRQILPDMTSIIKGIAKLKSSNVDNFGASSAVDSRFGDFASIESSNVFPFAQWNKYDSNDDSNDKSYFGRIPNLALDRSYLGRLNNNNFSIASAVYRMKQDDTDDTSKGKFGLIDPNSAGNSIVLVPTQDAALVPYLLTPSGIREYLWVSPVGDLTLNENVYKRLFRQFVPLKQFFKKENSNRRTFADIDGGIDSVDHMDTNAGVSNMLSINILPSVYHWAALGVTHMSPASTKVSPDTASADYDQTKSVAVLPMTHNVGFAFSVDMLNEDLDQAFYSNLLSGSDQSTMDIYYEIDYGSDLWGHDFSLIFVPFGSMTQNIKKDVETFLNKASNKIDLDSYLADWDFGGILKSSVNNLKGAFGQLKPNVSPNISDDNLYLQKGHWSGGFSGRMMFHASDLVSFGLGYIFQYSSFNSNDYAPAKFVAKSNSHGGFATVNLDLGMAGFNVTAGYILDSYYGHRDMKNYSNIAPISVLSVLDLGQSSRDWANTAGGAYKANNNTNLDTALKSKLSIGSGVAGSKIPAKIIMYTDNAGGDVGNFTETNLNGFNSKGKFHLMVNPDDEDTGDSQKPMKIRQDYRAHPFGKVMVVKPQTKFYQSFNGSRIFAQAQGYVVLPVASVVSFRPAFKINAQYGKLDDMADYLDSKYQMQANKEYFLDKNADEGVSNSGLSIDANTSLTPMVKIHYLKNEGGKYAFEGVKVGAGEPSTGYDLGLPSHKADGSGLRISGLNGRAVLPVFSYDNTQELKNWHRFIKTAFATYAKTSDERAFSVDVDMELPLTWRFITSTGDFKLTTALVGGYNILDPRSKFDVYLSLPYHAGFSGDAPSESDTASNLPKPLSGTGKNSGSIISRESHYLGVKLGLAINTDTLGFVSNYEMRLRGYDLTHAISLTISFSI